MKTEKQIKLLLVKVAEMKFLQILSLNRRKTTQHLIHKKIILQFNLTRDNINIFLDNLLKSCKKILTL